MRKSLATIFLTFFCMSALANNAIEKFNKEFGLFYFYRSNCPYCIQFAPILKKFVEDNSIRLIAITTDGVMVSEFPNSEIDNGHSQIFSVQAEPALYAVNPGRDKAYTLSIGFISSAELHERFNNFIEQIDRDK